MDIGLHGSPQPVTCSPKYIAYFYPFGAPCTTRFWRESVDELLMGVDKTSPRQQVKSNVHKSYSLLSRISQWET